jgi:hypothetical protein
MAQNVTLRLEFLMRQFLSAATVSLVLSATGLSAQEPNNTISLELNKATTASDGGCQVIFFGKNGLDKNFKEVTWRLAVFGADGVFRNLLALPLGSLSAGKRRVVQYNLPSACSDMSEIIVNDVASCILEDPDDGDNHICLSQLTVTSRIDIAFGL